MSFIELKKVCKQYPGTDKKAVTDFDLEINEKEFIAFVGTIRLWKIYDTADDRGI